MNVELDVGKIVIGILSFFVTFSIHRSIKRMDAINEKLEQLSIDLAELKGSVSGRFVINDNKPAEVSKLRK
jgi:hypothetical protein